jgi:hypothetical protein
MSKSIEVVLSCSNLDQLCEQRHFSGATATFLPLLLQPQTQQSGENRRVLTLNSLKIPKNALQLHIDKPCIVSSMQRFGACVVTVPLEWTGVCNISIIIKTCVNCTVACLFDRVQAPITSTLRPVSLHQPRATFQVRLLLAYQVS